MARRTWGRGSVRKELSGSWSIRWPEGKRRQYRGGFPSKALAQRALDVQLGRLAYAHAGVEADPVLTPTIGELSKVYLDRREVSHLAGKQDRQRWRIHVGPTFGRLRPQEVNLGVLRRWVEERRAAGVSASSLRVCLAALSGLFAELQEDGTVAVNPTKGLPPSIRRHLAVPFDPAAVPFLEKMDDVWRVILELPHPTDRVFALGALAGLRPAEARALDWTSVDLARGVIHVRVQAANGGPRAPKSKRPRMVPVYDALRPLLAEWHVKAGGKGLVCPGPRGVAMYRGTPNRALDEVLAKDRLNLVRPGLDWYACTRHTFASHFVLRGGTLEELRELLGHRSITTTQRYAHLRHDLFRADRSGILGSGRGAAKVLSMRDDRGKGVVEQ
ncbi:MAG: tyrosine-type recombinase/integrase [Actinomycetes bacterium]